MEFSDMSFHPDCDSFRCPDVSVFKGSGIRIAIAPKKIIDDALRLFSEFRGGRTLIRRNVKVFHYFNFSLQWMVRVKMKSVILFLTFTVILMRDFPTIFNTDGRPKKRNKVGAIFWKINLPLQQMIRILFRYGLKHCNRVFFCMCYCISIIYIFTVWGRNIGYICIYTYIHFCVRKYIHAQWHIWD